MTVPARSQALSDACPERGSQTPHEGELVVGLQLGPELNCALTAVLAPWGLQIKQSDETLGPSMPSTSLAARRISQAWGARIVVWLAQDSEGYALWVYDSREDGTVVRAAPAPPYDGPTAAALALSVKTAVRMVGVGPEANTDEESPPEVTEQRPQTSPLIPDRAPVTDRAPAALSEPPRRPVEPKRSMTGPWFGVYTAVRADVEHDDARLRFGGEVRLAPWGPWPSNDSQLWTGLGIELGPASVVELERYRGEFGDTGAELALGLTYRASDWFALATAASGALNLGTFSGEDLGTGAWSEHKRINPMVLARTEAQFRFGAFGVYLQPAMAYWAGRQRYVAFGDLVRQTPRWSTRLAAGLLLELD